MGHELRRRQVLKGIAGTAGVAGYLGTTGVAARQESQVNLGILMATTGDLGPLGADIQPAAELPVTQLGDSEAPIAISSQTEDTATDPQTGISAAEALVNAGYPMVNGPMASNVNMQVTQQVFIPNQVVGCSPSSTAPSVTDLEDDDFIFRTAPSDVLQGDVLAQVAIDTLGAETTATLHLNDDYGQQLSGSYVGAFEEQGGDVLNEVSFEPEQPSYTSRIQQALADDPDTLMIVGFPQSGIQLFRDYYSQFDTGADILITDGLATPDLPADVGNDLENVTGTAPSAGGPEQEFFEDLYEQEYGRSPTVFTSNAYDSSAVLILAHVAAGASDGAAIRDNMRTVANPNGEEVGPSTLGEAVEMVANGDEVNYQGASSTVDFDENGDVVSATFDILEFDAQAEAIEVIETIEFEGDDENGDESESESEDD
ncbi:ABC transporter substrate-binding protein [Halomontanus rarus]|uniref:ABC transporter substrate-binding protein n=1 Tax=Halomontanus rarus TaxID=3034020 RepID=UPI0023E83E70|nr:ABC transporter substrate-binding protein [Halovivax sp. TS33]